jgi:hypothetical protein
MRENAAIQNELNEISAVVAGVPFCNIYKIPDNYFTEFNERLKNKELSLANDGLIKENLSTPFMVPENYFSSLPSQINKKRSYSSSFYKILNLSNTSRKVAAGVLILMAGLFSFYFFYKNSNSFSQKDAQSAVFAEAKKIIANDSFEEELAQVDAADIEEYLTSNGHDVNAALMASVENDEEIPNEEELLMDDQAIDQLYKDLNLSSNTIH